MIQAKSGISFARSALKRIKGTINIIGMEARGKDNFFIETFISFISYSFSKLWKSTWKFFLVSYRLPHWRTS